MVLLPLTMWDWSLAPGETSSGASMAESCSDAEENRERRGRQRGRGEDEVGGII